MIDKKYFHEIDDLEWQRLKNKRVNWNYIKEHYQQPPWCECTCAVDPLGCWSLLDNRGKMIKNDCRYCEEFKND